MLCAAATTAVASRRLPLAHRPQPRRQQLRGRHVTVVPVRAYRDVDERSSRQGGSDAEGGTATGDFATLAKELTGQLAAQLSSNEDSVYNKLESWLAGSQDEEGEVAPRTDQTTAESDGRRLMRLAAEYWGMPTTVTDAVQSVKSWLSNPTQGEEGHDSQMVARLLHRLLDTYTKQEGEDFEGQEHQYDKLLAISQKVLGSSVSKRVLKSLVRAYLGL